MKLPWKPLLLSGLVGGLLAAAAALAWAYEPEIPAVARPDPRGFALAQVERGAELALIGDCAVCHNNPGGGAYAGGRPLPTPFGTMYVTNITPDEAHGIGTWSREAFRRAMRRGIARDGSHLYPALPYEHFTLVTDDDLDAIYAFLMTRDPVAATPPANALIPPLGFRPVLAGWKLLFLREGPLPATPGQSAEWQRGAYLAEGLGHCGSCHTPRNLAGAERRDRAYAGGQAEGYDAPPLDASNPAAGRWSVEALTTYLRTGLHQDHGVAGGPMAPVVHGLSRVSAADVQAIAVYVASRMQAGAASLFEGACGAVAGAGAPMLAQGRPDLSVVTALRAPEATNAIQAILRGVAAPIGPDRPFMPAFAESLTDRQVAGLLSYLRARFTDRPDWTGLADAVARIRKEDRLP
jgi:mono/diheme cytochrome c family protein